VLARTLPTTVGGAGELGRYVKKRWSGRGDEALLATAIRGIELSPALMSVAVRQ
jgi:hypothetical protein